MAPEELGDFDSQTLEELTLGLYARVCDVADRMRIGIHRRCRRKVEAGLSSNGAAHWLDG